MTDELLEIAKEQVKAALNPKEKTEGLIPLPSGSPNLLDQLEAKKNELLEIEKRLDQKKAEIEKESTRIIMGGRSTSETPKEISPAEKKKAAVESILKGTGLNPFSGEGAKALQ